MPSFGSVSPAQDEASTGRFFACGIYEKRPRAPAANPHELSPQPHRPAYSIHDGNNQSDENNDQEHSPEQPAAVLDKKLARHVSVLDGTRHAADSLLYANTIKLSR